ncbi:MAG: glutamine synthetase III [Coriobacteriia bacterium]|nr:glutamine synthetase III [Coriobacteriia bacterium]
MSDINELFGCKVFNDRAMRVHLPEDSYRALKKTIHDGTYLELDVANVVAEGMKNWALQKGVTHYTHWFQPMTNSTAEKHDSFIMPAGRGRAVMEFSGKELVRGEPDASSFPSGGLRATFEARGYTVWDTTSYAFIKDDTLCIPTAFCSYCGDALDKKTPLLRSMDALNIQALRILKLFGHDKVERIISAVGAEQEYFLVDRELYEQRPDLMTCGRTLMGAHPSKGQEMDDHYFASIKPRVLAYMQDIDRELWQMGVYAKTRHNEVAPGQYELACVYRTTNVSTDHNQLVMETLKNIAGRHGLVCLLHEKPFAGFSGSGKHNNWSISTDTGVNLLEPGATPADNAQFLLLLVAIIKASDVYQDLIRASSASAGNDHRLGGSEAPPAIVSMFLGDELTAILDAIDDDVDYAGTGKTQMTIGARALPHFTRDVTDRNRTSPFAFTGNKFEFRMPGSAFSIAGPNIVLNTTLAEILRQFADLLEAATEEGRFDEALDELVKTTYHEHKRIVFNGDNYSDAWVQEASRRGLSNLKSTPEALAELLTDKSRALYKRHKVLNNTELASRAEVFLGSYSKTIKIEAATMIDMVKTDVIPAVLAYQRELADLIAAKRAVSASLDTRVEEGTLDALSQKTIEVADALTTLEEALAAAKEAACSCEHDPNIALAHAELCRDTVLAAMRDVRTPVDALEAACPKEIWPYPSYAEIMNSVG